jgi:serine/threonine protein kinase
MMQVPLAPKPVRLGPYELLQKLATGGMAEIYVARREGPHGFSKRIALKRILPQLAADPEFVAMFIDEARLCAQLTHPNLVQVFDFGEEGTELYMAMELVEGTNVAKVVRAAGARGEGVPAEAALHIAMSVGRGLAHAHDACDERGVSLGLVHRDVSPGNILISSSGAVKLADFGIARAAQFDRRTDQGQLKGKLGYMSPEQVTGRELDAKSDQFTAAIVLAELLTARPIFSGAREMDVLVKIRDADLSVLDRHGAQIAPDIMEILRRALARRAEERFETTTAFVDALEEVVRRRRLSVKPATLVEWLHRMHLLTPSSRSGEHAIDTPAPLVAPSLGQVLSHHPTAESQPPTEPALIPDGPVAWRTLEPSGVIQLGELPLYLFDLVVRRATGKLTVRHGALEKHAYFVEGVPEMTTSNDEKELLGAFLIAGGFALPMEIEMALAVAPRYGGRLGDALVGLGVLRPIELVRAIVDQMRARFIALVGWKEGHYSFVEGELAAEDESLREAIKPIELITRGVFAAYRLDELEALLLPVMGDVLVPTTRAPVAIPSLHLPVSGTMALEAMSGRAPLVRELEALVESGISDRTSALASVFVGLSCGAFTASSWRSPRPRTKNASAPQA